MNKISFLVFSFMLFCFHSKCQISTDTNYVKSKIVYNQLYAFMDTSANYIQYYSTDALRNFFEKLKKSNKSKVKILHIGDSHLQADIGASFTRNLLQEAFGFGGRGSIFPYTIAKTHATYDYEVKGYGIWNRTRNIDTAAVLDLGITGITARTYDTSAGFEIQFIKDRAKIQPNFTRLKLFCHTGLNSFDCQYRLAENEEWQNINCSNVSKNKSCIEINLPHSPSSISMRVLKTNNNQQYFEIYGLSLESDEDKGILYNSVGINGAKLSSFLKENLYESQIAEFNPDLVIVDLIANDLAFGDFNQTKIETDLKDCIKKIKTSSPNTSIMLVGMQNIYVKGRNIINAGLYSSFLRQFSAFNDVSFYDYYIVSGGAYSMKKWLSNGLSSKDMCHLSTLGYNIKGNLFSNAILNSYLYYLKNDSTSLIKYERKGSENKVLVKTESTKKIPAPRTKKETAIVYKVKKGDSIFTIAKKYKTTPKNIKAINKLNSNKLKIGQTLKINN